MVYGRAVVRYDVEHERWPLHDVDVLRCDQTLLDGIGVEVAEPAVAHFAPGGVFLGTDATERWDVAAFRAYAHPHFARGKAWSFRAARRNVSVRGDLAWFDEDLETQNLGPARCSGVLSLHDGKWLIEQYVLSITVPNQRFRAVRELLERPAQ